MSHELKFLEAYLPELKTKKSLYELIEMCNSNRQHFVSVTKKQLYCPECGEAQLSFVEDETVYLRTKKNSQHSENCLLAVPLMDSKEISEFKKHPDDKLLNHQKQSLLNRLLEQKPQQTKINSLPPSEKNTIADKRVAKSGYAKIKKRLSEKRIDFPLSNEDYGSYKFFYGRVIIQIKEHKYQDGKFYNIYIYSLDNHKYICSLSMNSNIYYYFSQTHHFKELQDYECAIVFCAELYQNTSNDGKYSFINGKISHSNLIEIIEL